ncbi:MAG: DUF6524 family protein, partial [Pseudomonadota bacterium]
MAGLLIRWVVAFALLAATYNPTQWNFIAWSQANLAEQMPMVLLLGLLLLVGYIIYLRATLRSIGALGMALVLAVAAALGWVLVDYGLLKLDNPTQNAWLGLLALSLVLGVG